VLPMTGSYSCLAVTVNFNQGNADPVNSFPSPPPPYVLMLYDLMQKTCVHRALNLTQRSVNKLSNTSVVLPWLKGRAYLERTESQLTFRLQTFRRACKLSPALKQYYHLAVMQQFLYSEECETSTTSTPSQMQCTSVHFFHEPLIMNDHRVGTWERAQSST
jgi:hypothetical protein